MPCNELDVDPHRIGAIYVGSESHPYAVKPTGTIVGQAIGTSSSFTAADLEFACKAGTAAIQACLGLVSSNFIDLGLAIGTDVSQGAPGDMLENTAAAGGAAYLIGSRDLAAEIEGFYSFTTDTPDFWRRDGMPYPEHGGRFTGEPAYFKHVTTAAQKGSWNDWQQSPKTTITPYFTSPTANSRCVSQRCWDSPRSRSNRGLIVPMIGNTYSASSLIGLAATLDVARPGERIFMTSFGSGAGSDAFSVSVPDRIDDIRFTAPTVSDYIGNAQYLDYAMYAKHKGKLRI